MRACCMLCLMMHHKCIFLTKVANGWRGLLPPEAGHCQVTRITSHREAPFRVPRGLGALLVVACSRLTYDDNDGIRTSEHRTCPKRDVDGRVRPALWPLLHQHMSQPIPIKQTSTRQTGNTRRRRAGWQAVLPLFPLSSVVVWSSSIGLFAICVFCE